MSKRDMCKGIVSGNLTKDTELRYTKTGVPVCSFIVASNIQEGSVTYLTCVAWAKLAEVCAEYLHKGSQVLIDGVLKMRYWDEKEGGKKRQVIELHVSEIVFLGSDETAGPRREKEEEQATFDNSDIPF